MLDVFGNVLTGVPSPSRAKNSSIVSIIGADSGFGGGGPPIDVARVPVSIAKYIFCMLVDKAKTEVKNHESTKHS